MTTNSILSVIQHYQRSIEKCQSDEVRLLHCISKLYKLPVEVEHLQETGIGKTVNSLRKFEGEIGAAAKTLVAKWKAMVASEETPLRANCHQDEEDTTNSHVKDDDDDNSQNSRNQNTDINGGVHTEQQPATSKTPPKPTKEQEQNSEKKHKSDSDRKKHASTSSSHHKSASSTHSDSSRHKSRSSHGSSSADKRNEHAQKHSKSQDKEERAEHRHEKQLSRDCSERKTEEKQKLSSTSTLKNSSTRKDEHLNSNEEQNHYARKKEKHMQDVEKESGLNREQREHGKRSSSSSKDRDKKSQRDVHKHEQHKSSSKNSDPEREKKKHHSSSSSKSSRKSKDLATTPASTTTTTIERKRTHNSDQDSNDSKSPKAKVAKHSSKAGPEKDEEEEEEGIDSTMGANFADVLGMLNIPNKKSKKALNNTKSPSASSSSHAKSSSSSKDSQTVNSSSKVNGVKSTPSSSLSGASSSRISDVKPDLLSSSAKLEPLDPSIVLELPTISTNYRPMPLNQTVMDCVFASSSSTYSNAPKAPVRTLTDAEAYNHGISSKTMRTKIYSGVRTGQILQVPSLFDLCIRVLQKNIDALEYTGGVPFEVLRPVLERATPHQLLVFEEYNPYLMEDSDVLWQHHVQRHYRSQKRQELESWREMFLRCQEDQERKLNTLAQSIKQSQKIIAAPVRKTQLAFVDSMVKPPRNVQRKQEQYGTKSKMIATPAARVASLSSVTPNAAKTGDARLRVAASVRDHAQVSNVMRTKKAPLMAKTLQFMRGRHKR